MNNKKRIFISNHQKRAFTIVDADMFPLLILHKWKLHSEGYAYTRIGGKQTYLHELVCPKTLGQVVDHLNHNRLDNRRKNLRATTNSKNLLRGYNRQRVDLGVSRISSGKWQARACSSKKGKVKKDVYLGLFILKRDAIKARKKYLDGVKNATN